MIYESNLSDVEWDFIKKTSVHDKKLRKLM
jgi:hypothetical protein